MGKRVWARKKWKQRISTLGMSARGADGGRAYSFAGRASTRISAVEELFAHRQWTLNRCRRHATDDVFCYVTDATNQVLTPKNVHPRIGLGFLELIEWLEQSSDSALSRQASLLRQEILNKE